ncbi:hypothetical protein C0J52_23293 [Blattella germanica]|nr:hypothetical protein C0J52_23293 [Blattella germanica]
MEYSKVVYTQELLIRQKSVQHNNRTVIQIFAVKAGIAWLAIPNSSHICFILFVINMSLTLGQYTI